MTDSKDTLPVGKELISWEGLQIRRQHAERYMDIYGLLATICILSSPLWALSRIFLVLGLLCVAAASVYFVKWRTLANESNLYQDGSNRRLRGSRCLDDDLFDDERRSVHPVILDEPVTTVPTVTSDYGVHRITP